MNNRPGGTGWIAGVAPVERPVARARATYDRIAAIYDLTENPFERQDRRQGRRLLAARPGERVLEVGPGTGHCLAVLASSVGPAGQVMWVDLSTPMLSQSRRSARARYAGRVGRIQGDAHRLPLRVGVFDAVFMSFVPELIGTPQIPSLLAQCRWMLCPGGRLAVVSLQLAQPTLRARLYLAGRRYLTAVLDCRPIPSPNCSPPPAGTCGPAGSCPWPGCQPPPLSPPQPTHRTHHGRRPDRGRAAEATLTAPIRDER
jgi:demethylmenaquinone methyltransferase/2-methoxy-6-polyprenyl-1,4-benzoquinol methylase